MSLPVLILIFFVLLLAGVPIGFVMAISSAAYFLFSGKEIFFLMAPEKMFEGINSFVLMAIPFFMLAGEIMNRAGMSDRLVDFANMVVGRVRGGLAQVNVLASILFAGITGVALGDVAALGKIFVPSMVRQGYTRDFAAAVTAASSIIGPIIPPSIVTVLYAAVMEQSVGAMFAGAIIPGLLIGLSDMAMVYWLARVKEFPRQTIRFTPREFAVRSRDALLAIVMPFIIIGGILGGIFTPTEAAAVSVVYALVVGTLVLRTITVWDFWPILRSAVLDSSRLFFIIACAGILSWVFGIENLPTFVENVFTGVTENPNILIGFIILFFLIMGLWMEPGPQIILFAPVLWPIAETAGMHGVQFGIMLIVLCNIGLCTPPVGNILFAISAIADVRIERLSRELLPFLAVNLIVILLVAFVPEFTLAIPRALGFVG